MENIMTVKGFTFRTWVLENCVRIASPNACEIIEIDFENLDRYYGGKPSRFFGKCIGEWIAFA